MAVLEMLMPTLCCSVSANPLQLTSDIGYSLGNTTNNIESVWECGEETLYHSQYSNMAYSIQNILHKKNAKMLSTIKILKMSAALILVIANKFYNLDPTENSWVIETNSLSIQC